MATHLVTLGWDHPSRVLPSIMNKGSVERVELLCAAKIKEGDKEIAYNIALYLQGELAALKIPCNIHRVHPYETDDVYRKLVDIERETTGDIFVNITGGTKVMVVTAVMYAMTSARTPHVYYGAAEDYASKLPRGSLTPDKVAKIEKDQFQSWGFNRNFVVPTKMVDLLGRAESKDTKEIDAAAAILLALLHGTFERTKDLVEEARELAPVSVNTVRERLKELQDDGLVVIKRGGREGVPGLTEVGEELASLVQVQVGHRVSGTTPRRARQR